MKANGIYKAPKGKWYDYEIIYNNTEVQQLGTKSEAIKEYEKLIKESLNK